MDKQKGVVELCLKQVNDPFSLVVLASYRAQELDSGITATIETQGHKNAVLALHEIAEHSIEPMDVQERMIKNYQKYAFLADADPSDPGSTQHLNTFSSTGRSGASHAHRSWHEPWTPTDKTQALFETIEWSPSSTSASDDLSDAETGDDTDEMHHDSKNEGIYTDQDQQDADQEHQKQNDDENSYYDDAGSDDHENLW